MTEVRAILRKEARLDIREIGSFLTVALFSGVTIFAISVATFNQSLNGNIAAGLLWIALLFSAVIGQPRRFLQEEDQGTADLLRLIAQPHAIFWGKLLMGLLEMTLTAIAITGLFFLLTSAKLVIPSLYLLGLIGTILSLTGATCISGALASSARNRSTLAAAVALPLLVPIVFFGVACLRASLGDGLPDRAWISGWGLLGYGIASVVSGPWIFAATWRK